MVLNDGWRSEGVQEAANLLYDVAKALAYIHRELRLVHGDVKPDNIGNKDGAYILLDFGVCRDVDEFTPEATATGSLRTRAPELFGDGPPAEPAKIDVWALGATVFEAVVGRFPFIRCDEAVPRITKPEERAAFEQEIASRMRKWDEWVALERVPEPLSVVLRRVLQRFPAYRATATELVSLCEQHVSGFLRGGQGPGRLAAVEEMRQLLSYLPKDEGLRFMPTATRHLLRDRLDVFERIDGLEPDAVEAVKRIRAELG